MTNDNRPNPDDILNQIKNIDARAERGHLKVFFGMSPGVGKTFSMLRVAHEKKTSGVEVVIGLIETHQREDTQKLLEGFRIIPRKKIEYKGNILEEMDIDQILSDKPELVLVDELAHTNVPGSRHPKRYQDVEELLNAGIDVYTTLNVQHIESRADLIYQITGVPVRETVPDSFLEYADQMELIDLSPEELLKRLKEGKVYMGERAERAEKNFFKEENLIALRELALRFTAEKVDDQLKEHMTVKGIKGPWNINERLMVAISYSPSSARLIRAARRKAYSLEAPWIALYVDTGESLTKEDQETLHKNIALAKELGAEVITTRDSKVAEALKRIATEKNVTQIVMGRPDKRIFRDIIARGTILEQLVRETSEIDIHIIRQNRKPTYRGLRLPQFSSEFFNYWNTLWFLFGISLISYAISPYVGYRAIGFIYLLATLLIAGLAGLGPILFTAIFSTLVWDYFFIPPKFTFLINSTEDYMMVAAYFAVALVGGYLARRIRRQDSDLKQREFRANVLYDFGRELNNAKNLKDIVEKSNNTVERLFSSKATVLISDSNRRLMRKPLNFFTASVDDKDFAVATWTFENRKKAGWKTDTLPSSRCLCIPLAGRSGTIGVLMLFPKIQESLSLDQENLLDTIARNLATAIEREKFEEKSREAEILKKSEKLHQAILNSVSHEIRTPLTAIVGASSALSDAKISPDKSEMLIDVVLQSTQRLNQVVENLLDMSRISSGTLNLKKEIFELNDFIKSSLHRAEKLFSKNQIKFTPYEDLVICGDDRLLDHVMFNLLSNATKFSSQGSKVEVIVKKENNNAVVEIWDEGPGIAEHDLTKIFDRFYRAQGSPTGGLGLGLSIVKAIIEAHDGNVEVKNRSDRSGAIFIFRLPIQELPSDYRKENS